MENSIKNIKISDHQIAISYFGQAGFIIRYRAFYISTDPYLSYYVDEHCSNDDTLWIRNYPPPITPEERDFINVIICTHAHYDHMDPDTIARIFKMNKKVKYITPHPAVVQLIVIGIFRKL